MCSTRAEYLLEISQELARFNIEWRRQFRCPTCLRDYPLDSKEITEEHIIPVSQGGKVTTFLCKSCNSMFGAKQTRWLSDWIDLNEGGTPFHGDPRKQKVKVSSNGNTLTASLSMGEDGGIDIFPDKSRSDPKQYEAYWKDKTATNIKIDIQTPVFANEDALGVGFLTAAYGLFFKHFGYSFIFQTILDPVREQILNPDKLIIKWNYLLEIPKPWILEPGVGLMRFGDDIFPVAIIYDHIVILPNSKKLHPDTTSSENTSTKIISLDPSAASRFQGRCLGPAIVLCDFQPLIEPDFVRKATVPPQHIWIDGW
ncbi:HNH endonuclease [Cribrihabitans marinus]|uniref:HNH endonuclease n=2 Tax=Cribrihabitans marinus TaxID=1227549 RepID=A0A1H6W6I0_9RHOB|nr:hypothetical protein GCM10010973_11130 [Cribrihabitans marinus]SEJ12599.1 HNH endonuclease [Cribrihabitans marinus]